MEKISKWKRKAVAGVLGALLAGTALTTGIAIHSKGTKVEEYARAAQDGYCTVLVYMDGSDLESVYGAAADDLMEMENAVAKADPSGEKLRIVVEAGGCDNWQYDAMQPYQYGRFQITGQGVSEVTDMQPRDMGREDTLADFINYATQSYPAEHYGMIFWNHGAGQIEGFGKDENFNGSSMSLEQIKKGFELSDFTQTFDFIGMDACLMSNIELVSALQGKADYLIASEELEPQDGYDYKWMEQLATGQSDYGRKIGSSIVDSYDTYYKDSNYSYTLALIDINKYAEFHNRFDEILNNITANTAIGQEDTYSRLSSARAGIQGFGQTSDTGVAEQIDLMGLLWQMYQAGFCTEQEYKKISAAYEQMIVCSTDSGSKTGGISIYLPSGGDSKDDEVYSDMPFCDEYKDFIKDYSQFMEQVQGLDFGVIAKDKEQIKMEIPQEQTDLISNAYNAVYMSRDDVRYLIAADSDVTLDKRGYMTAPLEDTFWGLKGEILCMIENYSDDDRTEYIAPVLYKKSGLEDNEWAECRIRVEFSYDNPDGKIISISPKDTTKQMYSLEDNDEIIPLYPIYDTDNITNDAEHIYNGQYYKGNTIIIEDMQMGDGELEKITPENELVLWYGFLIRDMGMNLYDTELISTD